MGELLGSSSALGAGTMSSNRSSMLSLLNPICNVQRQCSPETSTHLSVFFSFYRRERDCPFSETAMQNHGIKVSRRPLFLAALLDALATGVEGSLAAGLGSEFLPGLLVCMIGPCQQTQSRGCAEVGNNVRTYRLSSSQGKPDHPRRGPWLPSLGP